MTSLPSEAAERENKTGRETDVKKSDREREIERER